MRIREIALPSVLVWVIFSIIIISSIKSLLVSNNSFTVAMKTLETRYCIIMCLKRPLLDFLQNLTWLFLRPVKCLRSCNVLKLKNRPDILNNIDGINFVCSDIEVFPFQLLKYLLQRDLYLVPSYISGYTGASQTGWISPSTLLSCGRQMVNMTALFV